MGMTKAELERQYDDYETKMKKARASHRNGLYRDAVKSAMSAWDHVDGMMQYARCYEKTEFDSIEAIDLVLKYAPLLFDYETLDTLESMLKTQRRIERDTAADMGDKLLKARSLMWDAHRMWNHIEEHFDIKQDELRAALGSEQTRWRSIAELWENMGLLQRRADGASYRLAFITRLGQVVSAKCPSCGGFADAPKATWLERTACPHCKTGVFFVILGKPEQSDVKE